MAELSAQDKIIAARTGMLFGTLMVEYEIYKACSEEEREGLVESFSARLRGLHPSDKETVIVFMLDIFSKIGPVKLKELLEDAQEVEME